MMAEIYTIFPGTNAWKEFSSRENIIVRCGKTSAVGLCSSADESAHSPHFSLPKIVKSRPPYRSNKVQTVLVFISLDVHCNPTSIYDDLTTCPFLLIGIFWQLLMEKIQIPKRRHFVSCT